MENWVRDIVLCPGEEGLERHVRIRELPMADGVFASTGCQVWTAAILLAEELLRRPELVAGKRVVEIGAGCGLLGVALAALARDALITDGDEECVALITENLRANEGCWRAKGGEEQREAAPRVLKWEDAAAAGWPAGERAEVVVGSDIIAGMFGNTVAQAFLNVLAPGGLMLLNAHEDRAGSIRGFRDHVAGQGFRVEETTKATAFGNFCFYECRPAEAPPVAAPPLAVPEPAAVAEPAAMEEPATDAVPAEEPARAGEEAAQEPVEAPAAPVEAPEAPVEARAAAEPARGEEAPRDPSSLSFQERLTLFKPLEAGPVTWVVVGGTKHEGLMVRSTMKLEAKFGNYVGKLLHGAQVRELERTALRLRFEKVRGLGPERGWVSLFSKRGTPLLEPAAA